MKRTITILTIFLNLNCFAQIDEIMISIKPLPIKIDTGIDSSIVEHYTPCHDTLINPRLFIFDGISHITYDTVSSCLASWFASHPGEILRMRYRGYRACKTTFINRPELYSIYGDTTSFAQIIITETKGYSEGFRYINYKTSIWQQNHKDFVFAINDNVVTTKRDFRKLHKIDFLYIQEIKTIEKSDKNPKNMINVIFHKY